jgi:hypothetical protein
MRILEFIVVACLGLALMQAAAKLAALFVIIAALLTFAARPRESIGCFGGMLLLGAIARFPLAMLLVIFAVVCWSLDRNRKP